MAIDMSNVGKQSIEPQNGYPCTSSYPARTSALDSAALAARTVRRVCLLNGPRAKNAALSSSPP